MTTRPTQPTKPWNAEARRILKSCRHPGHWRDTGTGKAVRCECWRRAELANEQPEQLRLSEGTS